MAKRWSGRATRLALSAIVITVAIAALLPRGRVVHLRGVVGYWAAVSHRKVTQQDSQAVIPPAHRRVRQRDLISSPLIAADSATPQLAALPNDHGSRAPPSLD